MDRMIGDNRLVDDMGMPYGVPNSLGSSYIGQNNVLSPNRAATNFPKDGRRVLGLGSFGEDVFELQKKLSELNYLVGGYLNGIFDRNTERAVRNFQTNNKLMPNGIVDSNTLVVLDKLYSPFGEPAQPIKSFVGVVIDPGHDCIGNSK